MNYKGYTGKVELDEERGNFHGEVLGIRDVVTFQATSGKALLKAFRDSVDDYLEFCKERGEEPDKPFSGKVVLRMSPDLHRRASIIAEQTGVSLNAWLQNCISQSAERADKMQPIG